jgi:hypothetical protein
MADWSEWSESAEDARFCTCQWGDAEHGGRIRTDNTDCPRHDRRINGYKPLSYFMALPVTAWVLAVILLAMLGLVSAGSLLGSFLIPGLMAAGGLVKWATQGMIDGDKARAMLLDLPERRLDAIIQAHVDCKPSWEDPMHPLYLLPPEIENPTALDRITSPEQCLTPVEKQRAVLEQREAHLKNLQDKLHACDPSTAGYAARVTSLESKITAQELFVQQARLRLRRMQDRKQHERHVDDVLTRHGWKGASGGKVMVLPAGAKVTMFDGCSYTTNSKQRINSQHVSVIELPEGGEYETVRTMGGDYEEIVEVSAPRPHRRLVQPTLLPDRETLIRREAHRREAELSRRRYKSGY